MNKWIFMRPISEHIAENRKVAPNKAASGFVKAENRYRGPLKGGAFGLCDFFNYLLAFYRIAAKVHLESALRAYLHKAQRPEHLNAQMPQKTLGRRR